MKEIIAIVNQKGGVGKTTTCINLASSLSKTKRTALLVDLDPQSNATRGCGIDPHSLQYSINDVLLERETVDNCLVNLDNLGFSILPATPQLTESEVKLLSSEEKIYMLKKILGDCSRSFDYVLIDCPPSLNILTVNALTSATSVIIPVQCEFFALQGLSELVKTIDTIKESTNKSINIKGIIRTMFDPRNNLTTDVSKQLLKHFPGKVFKTIIPRNVTLAEAPSHGLPVLDYDKNSKGSFSYLSLVGEIIKQEI